MSSQPEWYNNNMAFNNYLNNINTAQYANENHLIHWQDDVFDMIMNTPSGWNVQHHQHYYHILII